jgi:hypothetical protein
MVHRVELYFFAISGLYFLMKSVRRITDLDFFLLRPYLELSERMSEIPIQNANFIRDAKILQIFQAQSFSHQNPICLIQII